jgi:CheY-like chemotaxis protein
MQLKKYPFAVRLIGFAPPEATALAALLDLGPVGGAAYFCLHDDSLQEPDFYLVNGDDLAALAKLASLNPTAVQPAAIIGATAVEVPLPVLPRPLLAGALHVQLEQMVLQRADALSKITAAGWPSLPERRRRERIDFDLTDPTVYTSRRRAPPDGAILIVDEGAAMGELVVKLLGKRKVPVAWTDNGATALRMCGEHPVSVVLINVATARIDAYGLCASIKALPNGTKMAVVLLVDRQFKYDPARARKAGVRGLLDKPVADRHLVGTLQKLLSLT